MSLEYSRSSVPAIGKAINLKVDLIVLLTDESEESKKLEQFLNSPPSVNLIKNSKAVLLHLKSGEPDVENVKSTFKEITTPSVSLIGTQPTGLKVSIVYKEGLTIGGFLSQIVSRIHQAPSTTTSSSTSQAQSAPKSSETTAEKAEKLNEKLEDIRRQKAKKAADEQLEKERARREDGKKLAELQRQRDDQQLAEAAAKRSEERRADKAAKDEMLKIMAAEKEARIAKNKKEREEAEKRRAQTAKPERTGKKILIGIEMPNGSQPRKQFLAEADTMGDMLAWTQVLAEDAPLSSFRLVSKGAWSADIQPSQADKQQKLADFFSEGNTTRAQYRLVFMPGKSASSKPKHNQVAQPNFIVAIINWIFGLFQSLFGGGNSSERAAEPVSQRQQESGSAGPAGERYSSGVRKRTGRLHDLKRDDDNTTYNGNSSAQL